MAAISGMSSHSFPLFVQCPPAFIDGLRSAELAMFSPTKHGSVGSSVLAPFPIIAVHQGCPQFVVLNCDERNSTGCTGSKGEIHSIHTSLSSPA